MPLDLQDSARSPREEEDDVASQSSDEDMDLIEQWGPLVDALMDATKKAFPKSPSKESTQDFQTYWRNVFTQLSDSLAADPEIPNYLTQPPTKKFTVKLFEERHGLSCPCCLPDVDPNIVLENEGGVTKRDFMRGFVDCMYGDSLPKIFDEDGNTSENGTCSLVYTSDWMSSGGGADDKRIAYVSIFDEEKQVPDIFLYCCGPEAYLDKSSEKDDSDEEEEKIESKL